MQLMESEKEGDLVHESNGIAGENSLIFVAFNPLLWSLRLSLALRHTLIAALVRVATAGLNYPIGSIYSRIGQLRQKYLLQLIQPLEFLSIRKRCQLIHKIVGLQTAKIDESMTNSMFLLRKQLISPQLTSEKKNSRVQLHCKDT